jgi:predicted patatin/cPLA2 family phospholipase
MVDTDYIVDEIIDKREKLDGSAILSSQGVLNIVTTEAHSGRACVHNKFITRAELLRAMKATLRVPGPREEGIEIDGVRHLDGGLVSPIPLFSAMRACATHVLILATRCERPYTPPRFLRLEAAALRAFYGRALSREYVRVQQSDPLIELGELSTATRYHLMTRRPDATRCEWYTINTEILRNAEAEAIAVAERYLSGDGG